MADISKRDIQNITENAKNRIMERMLSRQDMQTLTDNTRDRIIGSIGDIVQSCHQQLYTQENARHAKTQRYIAVLENRLVSMDTEIKSMKRILEQINAKLDAQKTATVTLQPEQQTSGQSSPYTRYVYQSG